MPPNHENGDSNVDATLSSSSSSSSGRRLMATPMEDSEERVLSLVSVAFRTAGRRVMHISCGHKRARFIGGHATSPEKQGAQYHVLCCCPDCTSLPVSSRVMSLERFCEHSGSSSNDWETNITAHWKEKGTRESQSNLFHVWQVESSRVMANTRLAAKAKTVVYWPQDHKWHYAHLQSLDQGTGLCQVLFEGMSEPAQLSLACELVADRPRPTLTDLKMDMFLKIPPPLAPAEPGPSQPFPAPITSPSQPPVAAEPTVATKIEALEPKIRFQLPTNQRARRMESPTDAKPKATPSDECRPSDPSESQMQPKSNTAASISHTEPSSNEVKARSNELKTLWRSNLTSFADSSSPRHESVLWRAKWRILAFACLLLLIFVGAATWKTFAHHDVVVAQLAVEQDTLLSLFSSQVENEFVFAARSIYRLSLNPLDFFETVETPIMWAYMANHLDQLRLLNTSGHEVMRIDSTPNANGTVSIWAVTSAEDLQDKSSRYYTEISLQLTEGSVYVSSIDLNVEFGVVEVPYMPVYRISAPLIDGGLSQGFVIGNIQATHLWEEWSEKLPGKYTTHWDVLDTSLYYLASSHHDSLDLYGMSLPTSANITYDGVLLDEINASLSDGGGRVSPRVATSNGCVKGAVVLPYSALAARVNGVDFVEDGGGFVLLLTVPGDEVWAQVTDTLTGFYAAMAAGYLCICAVAACTYLFWHSTMVKAKQNEESHEFLANVSHDLRSPLHVMSSALQLLHTEEMSQKYEFRALQAAVESMLSLLSNTVYLYRNGADTHVPPQKRCLGEDLVTLTEVTAFLANEKDLYLHLELPDDLPSMLLVNWNGLKQVLVNLLSNAIKFTVQGGIVIHVHAEEPEPGWVRFSFSVSDTGPGLDVKPTDDSKGGKPAGLGLSICDRIIRNMSATSEVSSVKGQGCTFTVSNLMCEVVEAPEEPPVWRRLGMLCKRSPHPLRFVAVLDNDDSQRLLPRLQRLVDKLGQQHCSVEMDILHGESLQGKMPPLPPNCVVWVGFYAFQAQGLLNSLVEQVKASGSRLTILSYVCGSYSVKDAPSVLSDTVPHTVAYPPWTPERLAKAVLRSVAVTSDRKVSSIEEEESRKKEETNEFADLKVLVVDDMSVNRTIARRLFSKNFGLAIDEAAGGRLCLGMLEAAGQRWYDVILLDLQMPEMDGIETVIEIRKMEHRLGVRRCTAVGLSASVLAKDRIACLGAGMDDYFTKPMSVVQFRKLLKGVVSKKQAIASETDNGGRTSDTSVDNSRASTQTHSVFGAGSSSS